MPASPCTVAGAGVSEPSLLARGASPHLVVMEDFDVAGAHVLAVQDLEALEPHAGTQRRVWAAGRQPGGREANGGFCGG